MKDVIIRNMSNCVSITEGGYSLFGFAVEDYKEKYGLENYPTDYVFGAVLESGDTSDKGFLETCHYLTQRENEINMFVFDYGTANKQDIETLVEYFTRRGYPELEDVYEDRIVFASL